MVKNRRHKTLFLMGMLYTISACVSAEGKEAEQVGTAYTKALSRNQV